MSSRHIDLARELADGIASGRHPVGSLLPTEFELCEQFGASRYAVRKALDELQELGLISRRKNVGTRVESARPAAGFTQSVATVDELVQYSAEHERTLRHIDEVVADLALAAELGCPGGTRWLRISSVRMDGGRRPRPIGWSDVYVDASYTDIATLVREQPGTLISALIEQRYGRRIARIRQDVQAVSLPKALAEELRAEAGSPALKITRRYLDSADAMFEVSVTIHPADRFTFSMQMERTRE
jgi:DNA-binding GntR family transcriptional regulator